MYQFYINDILLPVTPSRLRVRIENKNQTLILVNEGEINLLKSPGLSDFRFQCLLPLGRYPFARYPEGFRLPSWYLEEFERLKVEAKTFPFVVIRAPGGAAPAGFRLDLGARRSGAIARRRVSRAQPTAEVETSIKVSLERYEIIEDARNGRDMVVEVDLKQFRSFGTKTFTVNEGGQGSATESREASTAPNAAPNGTAHTVAPGDTLWSVAQRKLGSGDRWQELYTLNRDAIEEAARQNGRASSSNGHWLFPGTEIRVPPR